MNADVVKRQIIVLSPEAVAFMNEPAKVNMMPMVDDIFSVDGPGRRWCWFVVYTAPKLERRVCRDAEMRRLGAYTPESKDWRKQSTRDVHQKAPRIEIVRPLFTRYAFVRLPAREVVTERGVRLTDIPFGALSTIDGVQEIIGTSFGQPITIADEIVDKIQVRQERGDFDKTIEREFAMPERRSSRRGKSQVQKKFMAHVPRWADVGSTVSIKSGPFADLCGMIEAILPDDKLRMGISMLGVATSMDIEIDAVRSIG